MWVVTQGCPAVGETDLGLCSSNYLVSLLISLEKMELLV